MNQKQKTIKSSSTIDEKHTEMLNKFHENESVKIPQLMAEKNRLKSLVATLQENEIDAYMEIKDKVQDIQRQIKSLRGEKKRYLLDNSKYIFDYFEEKKKISSGDNNQNVNVLNTFFKIKAKDTITADPKSDKYAQSKLLYQNYWRNVSNELTSIQDFVVTTDICENCGEGEMILQDDEGILMCNQVGCSHFVTYIIDSSKPTNKEPPNEVSYTAYIRLNHFKEILSQFQAKETTQIPEEVIEAIRARIKKERITDMSTIDYNKMREILRKLGYNKYFEHIQYINSIFGIRPPIMSEELHETLCVLFIEIQKPWALHCPADRTNFFNYTYTLYQLCVLLDQTQYLPYIPMLKNREKQLIQDSVWKKVTASLDWEFVPSI